MMKRWFFWSFFPVILVLSSVQVIALERQPLVRPSLKMPPPVRKAQVFDQEKNQWVEVDSGSKITLDERTGTYTMTWLRPDGQWESTTYEPRNKVDVIIEASVSYDPARQIYQYVYRLTNLPTSQQRLQVFKVQTQALVTNLQKPEGWRRSGPPSPSLRSFPGEWWRWSDVKTGRLGIPPGEVGDGFSLESAGLPQIVECYVEGYAPSIKTRGELGHGLSEALREVRGPNGPRGRTIGPVAIFQPVNPQAFLYSLMTMLDESLQLGWIDTPETKHVFRSKLESALQALVEGNSQLAKLALGEVITIAEQMQGTTLTSEVSAILKFNVQYLIEKT